MARFRRELRRKTHAGNLSRVSTLPQFSAANPRRAKFQKALGPAPHRNAARLQNFDAGIQKKPRDHPANSATAESTAARSSYVSPAAPILHGDHVQIRANFIFRVEHPRQFAHASSHSAPASGNIRRTTVRSRSSIGPSITSPPSGSGRSSTKNAMWCFRRRFHAIRHRRDVGVEAHARVLNIEDKRIDAFQHLRRRPARLAVQAVDRQPRRGIDRIRSQRRIHTPRDAVLRAEQRHQLYAGRAPAHRSSAAPANPRRSDS